MRRSSTNLNSASYGSTPQAPVNANSQVATANNPVVANGTTSNFNSPGANSTPAAQPAVQTNQPGAASLPNETENGNQAEDPLPAGWEMRYDVYGRR